MYWYFKLKMFTSVSGVANISHSSDFPLIRMSADTENLREKGNEYFKSGKLEDAVSCYTKALSSGSLKDADRAVLYKNRAACYLKLGRNSEAVNDASLCKFCRSVCVLLECCFMCYVLSLLLYLSCFTAFIICNKKKIIFLIWMEAQITLR